MHIEFLFQTTIILEEIALERQCFKKGNTPDLDKASMLLFDDFRSGKLGRITLEIPEEQA